MTNIVLPDSRQRSLAFYLATEEFVARSFEGEALFVWQSEPTVIYGRNQVLENEVNLAYCREHGVQVVQRRSGGANRLQTQYDRDQATVRHASEISKEPHSFYE